MSESGSTSEQLQAFNRADVAAAWQGFIEQRPYLNAGVRGLVIESWRRCRALGVAPQGPCAPLVGDIDALLESNDALLTAAAHTWEVLAHTLTATDIVLVVADAKGVILKVEGNSELTAAAAERGTGTGHDWSEQASGTNAIGTAIVLGHPTIVRSTEHYCAPAKIWDCAASPIRDQANGALLGILVITSMGNMSERHALALAVTAAHQIEHTLRSIELARSVQLLSWYRANSAQWLGQATLLLDATGRMITANAQAQAICAAMPPEFEICDYQPHAPTSLGITIVRSVAFHLPPDVEPESRAESWRGGVVVIAATAGGHVSPAAAALEKLHPAFHTVITTDRRLMEVMRRAERMARANAPILLNGETGSGKELFAHAIHACSNVAAGPFVAVNCGTLSKELAISELLGYEAGAFTGAASKGRRGKFEQADGGTLFLDEIGELPLDVQVHLLRVLQDQVIVRLGSNDERVVKVRIVAATHRDLERDVAQGRFRADLFFRLKVFSLTLPPLRARQTDIGPLVERFLTHLQGVYGLGAKSVSDDLVAGLARYRWPGNVRELHGLIETMYILSDRSLLTAADLPEDFMQSQRGLAGATNEVAIPPSATPLERETLVAAIEQHGDNMSMLARRLGISRSTLYRKLSEFGIQRGPARSGTSTDSRERR